MGLYNTDIKELTLDTILSDATEWYIYEMYLGQITLGRPMECPYRKDKHPSFALYIARNGSIMWKDFANGDSGNVVKLIQKMYDLTYKKALEKIYTDLSDNTFPKPNYSAECKQVTPTNSGRKMIAIQRKYFTHVDDKYWSRYYLTRDDLKKFNVVPIRTYRVKSNGEWHQGPFFYTNEEPMYAYKVFKSYKIYRPLAKNKNNKWRGTLGAYDIQGFQQLPDKGDILIITKSLKDVMVLYKLGYSAVAPSSESTMIPKKVIEHLQGRFKRIIIFYDNDIPGVLLAERIVDKYNLPMMYIPWDEGAKDISDYVEAKGLKQGKLLIEGMLNNLNLK